MASDISDASPSVSGTPTPAEAQVSSPGPSATPEISSTPPTPDASAQPSSAPDNQGTETKEDLLSAVLKVVKPDPDADKVILPGEAPPGLDGQKSSATDEANTEDLPPDPSKEEMERYTARTRKRVTKLLGERDDARRQVAALQGSAQVTESLRGFLQQNDIDKEDFSLLLDLGVALRRGDFATFRAGITPYLNLADEALGHRVPDDLAQRVQMGHMTTEQARMFGQERLARQMAESQAQRQAYQSQQHAARSNEALSEYQRQSLQQNVAQAVTAWENRIRQTDPDYGRKQDTVKNLLWAVVQERGAPQTPEAAVEIATEAYRRANEMVSKFAPKPRATQSVPSSINRNNGAMPEPKSMMDAALLGLSKSRRSA